MLLEYEGDSPHGRMLAKEMLMNRSFLRPVAAFAVAAVCSAAMPPASHPAAPLVVALGDSITYGYGLPSRTRQNYAALYTASIGGKLVNLGQPGYNCQDVLKNEVPNMPTGARVVILYCGTNDVGGFDFSPAKVTRAPAATDAELAAYEKTFASVLAAVRAKEPHAKLYLLNLRHWQGIDGPEPRQFARDVDAWNAMLEATHLQVVDLCGDARMYNLANFLHDEIHPNVAGSKAMAGDFKDAGPPTPRCGVGRVNAAH
jgi:lysophospholipase L1-like esterase